MRSLSKDRDQRQKSAHEFFAELSGGGGLTLNEPIPASFGSAGTAEMAALPDFGGASVPAAVAPAGAPAAAPAPTPGAMAPGAMAPAPVPGVQPPPARAGGGGGLGKLLIFGLVALLGLLGIAIVVVVLRTMKPTDEPEAPLANPFESAEPISVTSELPDAAAQAADSAGETPEANATGKPTSTSTAPAPTSTSTTPRPQPTSTSTSPPPSTGGADACDACISAARSGNISGALASYRRCNDPGKKATCSDRAKTRAASAAQTAARNGQCSQAKAIIAAAKAMGAGSGRLDGALAGTSCQ